MSNTEISELQRTLGQLRHCVGALRARYGDVPAVLRLANDLERIDIDAADFSPALTAPVPRQAAEVEVEPGVAAQEAEGAAQAGQHAEPEQVHLEDAERVEVVLVPLKGVRPGMAALDTMANSTSGPRVMTKPPTWVARWRGKPWRSSASPSAIKRRRSERSNPSPAAISASGRSPPGPQDALASRAVTSSDSPIALPTSRTALRVR